MFPTPPIRPALLSLLFLLLATAPSFAFDGERALELVRKQCLFGPRVPGSVAHDKCREWIVGELKSLNLTVVEEPFDITLPLTGARVHAVNIWGIPDADGPTSPALLVSAHWDTRPWADRDPSGNSPSMLGANDGGSGVAVALELARSLNDDPSSASLALAFWDVEDAGVQQDLDSWGLGARHAAQNPPAWIGRVALGINLDMVGGKDLALTRETYSVESAPRAVESLWQLGRALAPERFNDATPYQLMDDHVHWIKIQKLPFVDLIGFPYKQWHTAGDSPENCSSAAMQSIGDVLVEYIKSGTWKTEGR